MASGGPTRASGDQRQLERLTCTVCMEVFRDPKLLPCSHTFCQRCLARLVNSSRPRPYFRCPNCRAEVKIPPGGVSRLQNNFYLLPEELEAARNAEKQGTAIFPSVDSQQGGQLDEDEEEALQRALQESLQTLQGDTEQGTQPNRRTGGEQRGMQPPVSTEATSQSPQAGEQTEQQRPTAEFLRGLLQQCQRQQAGGQRQQQRPAPEFLRAFLQQHQRHRAGGQRQQQRPTAEFLRAFLRQHQRQQAEGRRQQQRRTSGPQQCRQQ